MLAKVSAWFVARWATMRSDDSGFILELVLIVAAMIALAILVLGVIKGVVDRKVDEISRTP